MFFTYSLIYSSARFHAIPKMSPIRQTRKNGSFAFNNFFFFIFSLLTNEGRRPNAGVPRLHRYFLFALLTS